jgi:hypothetical protein
MTERTPREEQRVIVPLRLRRPTPQKLPSKPKIYDFPCISPKKVVPLRKFCVERRNTMGKKDENILNDFEKLIEETSKEGIRVIDEVAKSRLKEYKAIQSRNLL